MPKRERNPGAGLGRGLLAIGGALLLSSCGGGGGDAGGGSVPPPTAPSATLTLLPNLGAGTGSLTCSAAGAAFAACAASYASGTTLLVRATAIAGSSFTGWLDGTANATGCNGSSSDCAITLSADSALRAGFSASATYSVSAAGTTSNGGGGTVRCSADGGAVGNCGSYRAGAALVVTATPDARSVFAGWSGGSAAVAACNGSTAACAFTLTAATSLSANFNRPTLTVSVVGNGSVRSSPAGIAACIGTCAAPFDRGTTVNLTATVGLASWAGGGCTGNASCSTNLSADTGITATFAAPGLPPFAQQAYAKASNAEAGDGALMSVALSGDTLVVGMPQESSNATGVNGDQADNSALHSGAVYVFTRIGGVWSQQAYLKASNTEGADQFGLSVAIDGDTLVVGTGSEDSNATGVNGNQADNSTNGSGAAYVFTRLGGTWTQQAYLKASNAEAGDIFGESVAIAGDTIAVAARFESSSATGVNGNQADNGMNRSGAVYVFARSGGVWTQQAYLKASNTDTGDEFGHGLALSADTLAVAARLESSNARGVNGNQADNSAAGSGAVYVFTRSNGVWNQQAYLKASNSDAGDTFGNEGHGVALWGDTLVVGAMREDSGATGVNGNQADNGTSGSGAAFVFKRTAGVWSQSSYLKASNTGVSDLFGWAVAVSGDSVVVTAPGEASNATGLNGNQADNSAFSSGAAYVFVAQ